MNSPDILMVSFIARMACPACGDALAMTAVTGIGFRRR